MMTGWHNHQGDVGDSKKCQRHLWAAPYLATVHLGRGHLRLGAFTLSRAQSAVSRKSHWKFSTKLRSEEEILQDTKVPLSWSWTFLSFYQQLENILGLPTLQCCCKWSVDKGVNEEKQQASTLSEKCATSNFRWTLYLYIRWLTGPCGGHSGRREDWWEPLIFSTWSPSCYV